MTDSTPLRYLSRRPLCGGHESGIMLGCRPPLNTGTLDRDLVIRLASRWRRPLEGLVSGDIAVPKSIPARRAGRRVADHEPDVGHANSAGRGKDSVAR
jgi:hypothetical protein